MALENIKKRAKKEQEALEEGVKASVKDVEGGNVSISYNGKEFSFPKQQPAWVPMFVAVKGKGNDKELSDSDSLEFLLRLIGNDLAEEIVDASDNDFSISDLAEEIVNPIQSYWADKKK
jgi:hypothetical protein